MRIKPILCQRNTILKLNKKNSSLKEDHRLMIRPWYFCGTWLNVCNEYVMNLRVIREKERENFHVHRFFQKKYNFRSVSQFYWRCARGISEEKQEKRRNEKTVHLNFCCFHFCLLFFIFHSFVSLISVF